MKKHLKRFRCWLVHKLGGYLEEERIVKRTITPKERIPLQAIVFEKRIPRDCKPHEVGRELYLQQEILSEFTARLLKQIFESSFVDFALIEDPFTNSVILRGVTRICVPENAMSLSEAIYKATERVCGG